MTALNKQALREAAEKAKAARVRLESMPDEDVVLFEDDDIKSDVYTCNKFIVTANPATVLALLDELETAEKRIAELEARTVTLPYLPDDCDRTEAHFKYQAAITAAGIGVKGG